MVVLHIVVLVVLHIVVLVVLHTVESHSQNVQWQHFVLVKCPELSHKDKSIQTKVTSILGKWKEEKAEIFVFKCGEEKSKVLEK